jgi:hypothetical protein
MGISAVAQLYADRGAAKHASVVDAQQRERARKSACVDAPIW